MCVKGPGLSRRGGEHVRANRSAPKAGPVVRPQATSLCAKAHQRARAGARRYALSEPSISSKTRSEILRTPWRALLINVIAETSTSANRKSTQTIRVV